MISLTEIGIGMIQFLDYIVGQFSSAVLVYNTLVIHGSWTVAEPLVADPHIAELPDVDTAAAFLI